MGDYSLCNAKTIDALDEDYNHWVALMVKGTDFDPALNNSFVKRLANEGKSKGIYITINKPFKNVEESLKKSKIQLGNIYFVDLTSGHSDLSGDPENASIVEPPSNLTKLAISFVQAAKMLQKESPGEPIFVVVDSINTFLVYNNESVVKRFFHFLVSKAREMSLRCLLLSTDTSEAKSLNGLLGEFSDGVIKCTGGKK